MTGAARRMGRMNKAADNRYFAPSEVAHLLNVSMSSVYRACEEGSLPHVQLRPNGALWIPASAL
jgi:excisionase family DNA binding protein